MLTRRFFFFAITLAIVIILVPLYWLGSIPKANPDAVMNFIGDGEAPAILDVRTKSEFDRGHLPSAINASVFSLVSEHDELAISQQEPLIVYCGSGLRARIGAMILKLSGYEAVYLLEGNLRSWKSGGYPIIVA